MTPTIVFLSLDSNIINIMDITMKKHLNRLFVIIVTSSLLFFSPACSLTDNSKDSNNDNDNDSNTTINSVSDLTATPKNELVVLSWTNPPDSNLTKIKLIRKEGSAIADMSDGIELSIGSYNGVFDEYRDSGRTNGVTCYYGVYACIDDTNCSQGEFVDTTPFKEFQLFTWNNTRNETDIYPLLNDLFVSSDTRTIVAACEVGLLLTRDGGSSISVLTRENGLLSDDISRVWMDENGVRIYAGMNRYGLSISTDGGDSWTDSTEDNGLEAGNVYDIWGNQDGTAIYVAGNRGLFFSSNSGSSWTQLNTNDINGVWASEDGSLIYAAGNREIHMSADGGATWDTKYPAEGRLATIVYKQICASPDGQKIYISSYNGGLSFSTDGGDTWVNKGINEGVGTHMVAPGSFNAIYASSDGDIIAVGFSSGISISTDGGDNWDNHGFDTSVNAAWIDASGLKMFAATEAGLFYSSDSGANWSSKANTHGLGKEIENVFTNSDGSKIYAASEDMGLSVSTDSGTEWTTYTKDLDGLVSNDLTGVWAGEDGFRIYVTTSSGISISEDSGTTWTAVPGTSYCRSIFASADGLTIFSGFTYYGQEESGLFFSVNGGSSWAIIPDETHSGGDDVSDLFVNNSGQNIYLASNNGGLSVSLDSGASWTNYSTAAGLGSNKVVSVWASQNNEMVYACTSSDGAGTTGALYRSVNGGADWFDLGVVDSNSGNNIEPLDIWASDDGSIIYVVSSFLYISTDSGSTWETKNMDDGLATNNIYSVTATPDGGKIFLGVGEGIYYRYSE